MKYTTKSANGCIEILHQPHRRLKYGQPAGVATLTVMLVLIFSLLVLHLYTPVISGSW